MTIADRMRSETATAAAVAPPRQEVVDYAERVGASEATTDAMKLTPALGRPSLGLGLGLMVQLSSAFGIENRQRRGTIVSLRFSLAAPGA